MRLASRAVLLNLTLCEVPCSGLHPVGGICVGRRASRKRNQTPSFSPPRFPQIDLAILHASAHLLRNIGLRRRETSGSPRSCKEADNWIPAAAALNHRSSTPLYAARSLGRKRASALWWISTRCSARGCALRDVQWATCCFWGRPGRGR